MKIAVITDDGKTVCQHFGRALYYLVFNVENGKITGKEQREKAGHHTRSPGHPEPSHGEAHGKDAASQSLHTTMAMTIEDCPVLIAGGMGYGAYESLKSYNIQPIITDEEDIEQAVKLYLEGKLVNQMEKLH